MLTQEKTRSVTVMPKFEGLKKWRVPFPAGARKMHFEQIATTVAKITGPSLSLA
jgi:hypothetical protein